MTWTLWGRHPEYANGIRLQVMSGSLAECRREQAFRKGAGWDDLGIYRAPKGGESL